MLIWIFKGPYISGRNYTFISAFLLVPQSRFVDKAFRF